MNKRYRDNYKLIDWSGIKETRKRTERAQKTTFYFLPDIAPFRSPLDFSEISSRSALREHEKKHGVRQCGELKKPEDFANQRETFSERKFDAAYRVALEKHGLS